MIDFREEFSHSLATLHLLKMHFKCIWIKICKKFKLNTSNAHSHFITALHYMQNITNTSNKQTTKTLIRFATSVIIFQINALFPLNDTLLMRSFIILKVMISYIKLTDNASLSWRNLQKIETVYTNKSHISICGHKDIWCALKRV